MRHLLTILLILLAATGWSQDSVFVTHYDDHNGMSQWHVTKMLQDRCGFMWFASWNGLDRFDGYSFAVFKSKPGDGNNLTSDRIRNMLLGDDGHIYCVNNDVVWRFNLQTYKFEKVDAATQERYLARMNYDTTVFKDYRQMSFGKHSFDDVRQQFVDMQKNLWLMRRFGVERVSHVVKPASLLPTIPNATVRALYRDRKGRVWVGLRDSNTIAVLDSVANLIGYLGTDGRLHKERVQFLPTYSFYQQKDGTMWIGTKPYGLFRLKEQTAGVFSMEHLMQGTAAQVKSGKTVNSNDIYCFAEDAKGRLWIATQGGGINLLENPQADVSLLRFHSMDNTLKSFPQENKVMRRVILVKDKAGKNVLLMTTTEGLVVADNMDGAPGKIRFVVHQRESQRASSLSCSATMDCLIDRKGRLFVSTESGGVNMLLTDDLHAPSFDFRHYNVGCGMGSDVALAMTEVGDEIMVQCNNHIVRLNVDLNEIENYNDRFFSMTSRFSDAAPLLLRDGRWLLSLEMGLMCIAEEQFKQRQYVPRLVLTSFIFPGGEADYSAQMHDTLRLTSSQRDVTINYSALDYSGNRDIRYVTRLTEQTHWWQGKDSVEWSVPNEAHSTSLYNLDPGTYTLEIRSTNAEGLWVDNVRTLTIIVEPMFWETTVAYIIYILFFILVVAGITYTVVYIRNLERQREENLQAYLKLLSAPQPEEEPKDAAPAPVAVPQVIVSSPIVNEEDDAFMHRLMDFVDTNLGDSSVGVDEMASATATSRSSLNRKMKHLLGVTPADFLREARMKRAQQMLLTTARGVNDIAYSCGFSDPKYFSKCFKATVGVAPSEYRAQARPTEE